MGNAIVKSVKKVKKLEGILKRRNMILSDSEEDEPEAQGRKSQDDPLVSLVQGLVTPSMTIPSGEEQVEDICLNILEAAKNSLQVALLKPKSLIREGRYKRRKRGLRGKKVVLKPGFSRRSQREGKAPMIIEETPKKSKEQILQEEASLAEAIRLDSLQKEEVAKQVHLDSLLAQRIVEEEELNEQQKKRKAQVQFEAQHYTDEDWDLIRAKIEANAELSKNRGHGVISAKNLSFDEVKIRFDKLVNTELQTKTTKRLKDDEAKDAEPAKKSGKRRKQMARKGLHTDLDKDDSEAMSSTVIATYKDHQEGD
ncbi:hypothetical protein Tco_1564195 [Tanacetum coccineum]